MSDGYFTRVVDGGAEREKDETIAQMRDMLTSFCLLVGNANRRGETGSMLNAMNILRRRAIDTKMVDIRIDWDATPDAGDLA